MNLKVFVYGLLRKDMNHEMAQVLNENSRYLGEGKVKGRLFDTGFYPGALLKETEDYIIGDVFELKSPDFINELDDFENIGPDYAEPHEYTRIEVPVQMDEDTIICWIYVYNWPYDSYSFIEGGDYLQFIRQFNNSNLY